jgi:hypothetical protein
MFIKIREMKLEAKSNEAMRPCCDVTFPVNSWLSVGVFVVRNFTVQSRCGNAQLMRLIND